MPPFLLCWLLFLFLPLDLPFGEASEDFPLPSPSGGFYFPLFFGFALLLVPMPLPLPFSFHGDVVEPLIAARNFNFVLDLPPGRPEECSREARLFPTSLGPSRCASSESCFPSRRMTPHTKVAKINTGEHSDGHFVKGRPTWDRSPPPGFPRRGPDSHFPEGAPILGPPWPPRGLGSLRWQEFKGGRLRSHPT